MELNVQVATRQLVMLCVSLEVEIAMEAGVFPAPAQGKLAPE